MSQALQTASTGINAGQQQINVIANNVANINTVAYKSANMTFETLFSNTLSHGSAATKEGGGTNPMQIGLGVKIGGISRNFEVGTFVNTGRDTDVMISGNGYFVVQDSDGTQYFTRDGVFTTDSDGNLVTQSGMKVVGASSPYSGTPSSATVRIPTNLKTTVTPSNAESVLGKKISDLNEVSISSGVFNVIVPTESNGTIVGKTRLSELSEVTITDGKFTINVDGIADAFEFEVDNQALMNDCITEWNTVVKDYNTANGTSCDLTFALTTDGKLEISCSSDLTMSDDDETNFLAQTGLTGTNLTSSVLDIRQVPIAFTVDAQSTMQSNIDKWNQIVDNYNLSADKPLDLEFAVTNQGELQFITARKDLEFEPVDTNIFAETKITPTQLTSKSLNSSAIIQDLLDYNDPNGIAVSSVTIIDENGILSASYSDGSNLTTQINELGQAEWRFTTPDGTIITGTDVTTKGSINTDSNMIIELASFINEEGLVSINNNLWKWGPDAGEIFYGMAGEMAFGSLESGGYEGSNVDIATELSNMITAQRMIQMNSRVFGTASTVMETLAYLGQ
ncbi:MAG: flagellar hook-basal body complex protein [Cyanobacteria bacterium SIG31]|nr:flagellar hook-basal body complex protein [Cyanobacteria bacterium SIG31]